MIIQTANMIVIGTFFLFLVAYLCLEALNKILTPRYCMNCKKPIEESE